MYDSWLLFLSFSDRSDRPTLKCSGVGVAFILLGWIGSDVFNFSGVRQLWRFTAWGLAKTL